MSRLVIQLFQEESTHNLDDDEVDNSQVIDQIFGFLPGSKNIQHKFSRCEPQSVENTEDLSDYTFQKFSATHFQGQNTVQHISRKLNQPLLAHENDSDNKVDFHFHFLFL